MDFGSLHKTTYFLRVIVMIKDYLIICNCSQVVYLWLKVGHQEESRKIFRGNPTHKKQPDNFLID